MATSEADPAGASNVAQAPEEDDGPYSNVHGDNESGIESTLRDNSKYLYQRLYALKSQTHAAGEKVFEAAAECRNIAAFAEESATQAKKRSAAFERKAREMPSSLKAEHYRWAADKLDIAAKLTIRRTDNFETSLKFADHSARLAWRTYMEFVPKLMCTEANRIPKGTINYLNYTRRNANSRTSYLKQDEYYVLKAMRRCWKKYPLPWEGGALQNGAAYPATPHIPRDQPDNGPCKRISTILTIRAIAGVLLLILYAIFNTERYSFGAMLTVGILSTLWSLSIAIPEIIRRLDRKVQLAYCERRKLVLKLIDERLKVLSEYFATNRTDLLADAVEEKDPHLLVVQRKRPELMNPYYD